MQSGRVAWDEAEADPLERESPWQSDELLDLRRLLTAIIYQAVEDLLAPRERIKRGRIDIASGNRGSHAAHDTRDFDSAYAFLFHSENFLAIAILLGISVEAIREKVTERLVYFEPVTNRQMDRATGPASRRSSAARR